VNRPSDPVVWDRLREIVAELPDVSDKISHGELTWFVGPGKKPKQFANTWDHHHDDRNSVVMAAPPGAQEQLIADDPDTYFRPPYVGGRGWIGIHLDTGTVDWDRVELHLHDAHAFIRGAR
jgi:hypothetical protein